MGYGIWESKDAVFDASKKIIPEKKIFVSTQGPMCK
jgi:hypothetical protein